MVVSWHYRKINHLWIILYAIALMFLCALISDSTLLLIDISLYKTHFGLWCNFRRFPPATSHFNFIKRRLVDDNWACGVWSRGQPRIAKAHAADISTSLSGRRLIPSGTRSNKEHYKKSRAACCLWHSKMRFSLHVSAQASQMSLPVPARWSKRPYCCVSIGKILSLNIENPANPSNSD